MLGDACFLCVLFKNSAWEGVMKKFFDVVAGDEVDVSEPDVFFYLIQVPNGRYKLHGISGDPETEVGCEPETRIEHFWPITLKQLQEANQTKLFENDVLNEGPFELSEVEEIFETTDFSLDPAEQRRFNRVNNSGQPGGEWVFLRT